MSKHTPGPWLIGETIATEAMCVIGDGDSVICEFSGSGETVDADARLIAAAPELLDEHTSWAKVFGFALVRAMQDDFEPIKELARSTNIVFPDGEPAVSSAAIAKATGGDV